MESYRPLAVVTGASSGIGYHLARCCAENGFDLVVAADQPLENAARDFESWGAHVTAVQTELASSRGVDELYQAIAGRKVNALLANAGHGLGKGFLEQDFEDIQHVIVRISELLDSRFGTVVTEFNTTVRRRQIACPSLRNSWDGRLDFGYRPTPDIPFHAEPYAVRLR